MGRSPHRLASIRLGGGTGGTARAYLSVCTPQLPTNTLSETQGQIERDFSRANSKGRGQFLKQSLCDSFGREAEIRPVVHKLSRDASMLSVVAVEGKK